MAIISKRTGKVFREVRHAGCGTIVILVWRDGRISLACPKCCGIWDHPDLPQNMPSEWAVIDGHPLTERVQ